MSEQATAAIGEELTATEWKAFVAMMSLSLAFSAVHLGMDPGVVETALVVVIFLLLQWFLFMVPATGGQNRV